MTKRWRFAWAWFVGATLVLSLPPLASAQFTTAQMYALGKFGWSSAGTGGVTITAPILLPDGTAAAPSLSFSSTTNAGMFLSAGYRVPTFTAFGTAGLAVKNDVVQILSTSPLSWTATVGGSSSGGDLYLYREAANTLALRNSTTAQTFNVYGTFTDASNYERAALYNSSDFYIATQAAGSGSTRNVRILPNSGVVYSYSIVPQDNDQRTIGSGGGSSYFSGIYISRFIQGFKTKTITDASATAFVRIALAQTLGANFTGGELLWQIHCDNGSVTTYADRTGQTVFSCNNISGTEACVFDATAQQVTQAATYSLAAPTFGYTAGTDTVDLTVNADCGGVVGPTNMYIHYRLNILDPQTLTPQ